MAEELSALAKSLETSNDPTAIKNARAAVVMKAKNLISQVQDPMDAIMDHVTNVSPLSSVSSFDSVDLNMCLSRYLWSPLHALSWRLVFSKQSP